MHVAVTGSCRLIGSALVKRLGADGHQVTRLVRRNPRPGEARWNPADGTIETAALRDVDAAVHLAGAGHRRPPLDRRVQAHAARQPHHEHRAARVHARRARPSRRRCCSPDRRSATTARTATRSSTRPARRRRASWPTCAAMGSGDGCSRRRRHPRRRTCARASCSSAQGGALKKQLPLYKLGLGGRDRLGPAVAELDLDRRRGRRDRPPAAQRARGPGQPHGAEPGHAGATSPTRSARCCTARRSCRRRRSRRSCCSAASWSTTVLLTGQRVLPAVLTRRRLRVRAPARSRAARCAAVLELRPVRAAWSERR